MYFLVGVLLAIPYCILAGWNPENFVLVAYVAPAFLFIWFMFGSFAGVLVAGHGKPRLFVDWRAAFGKTERPKLPGFLVGFWAWTTYCLLPIILHWSAVLLEKVGYVSWSTLLNDHRYASPFYLFAATIALLIVIAMIQSAWESTKSGWSRLTQR